jgi:hypothetical protein
MMSAMNPADESGTGANADATPSVLANLPRTRPQRASARRTAARSPNGGPPAESRPAKAPARRKQATRTAKATASSTAAKPKRGTAASKRARPTAAKSRQPARKTGAPQAVSEPVPPQGFESESANASGPVPPPGGAELLATAAEIVSEVARASVSTGERLLRDALSRLRP